MFSLEMESEGEAKDLLIAELWERGSTGIVETDLPGGRCLLRAFFEDEADLDSQSSAIRRSFASPSDSISRENMSRLLLL